MTELDVAELPPEQLAERVFNLSADKFLAVYRLYEQLGRQKTVESEMQILRQRLRRLRPRRAPTFTRLLCLPFEAFISESPAPGPYLIPRKHCRLLGRLVRNLLEPDDMKSWNAAIARLPADDVPALLKVGGGFWRKAAQALRAADIRPRKNRQGSLRESIELITGCLDVGAQMASLTMGLPSERFRQLDGNARSLVASTIKSIPENRLDDLRYPLILLSLRLETPPAIIPLLQDQAIDIPDRIRVALIRMMSRYLEMDLQAEVSVVEEIAREPAQEGPQALLKELLPSIRKAMANRSAGVGGIPAQSVMETAGEVVRARIVAPAPDSISSKLSDLLAEPAEEQVVLSPNEADLHRARKLGSIEEDLAALSDLMEHADSLGLRREIRAATDAARDRIDETADNLMDGLQAATTIENVNEYRRNVYGMVRMIEMLEGPDKADQLRRKCNSIIASKPVAA